MIVDYYVEIPDSLSESFRNFQLFIHQLHLGKNQS